MSEGLGLFIRDDALDLVHLRKKDDKLLVINTARSNIRPCPPEKKRDALFDSMKRVFEEINVQTKNLTVCLPPKLTRLKHIESSNIKAKKAKRPIKIIEEEGMRLISATPNDITGFHIYRSEESPSDNTTAIVAAADKNSIEDYRLALQKLRITPRVMEPLPISMLRILRVSQQIKDEEPTLILFFESDLLANASIVKNGRILLSRNIYSTSGSTDQTESFIRQLSFIFDYFKTAPSKAQISKIILCGLSDPGELIEKLVSKIKTAIKTADLSNIVINLPDPHTWSAAIGAATRTLCEESSQINLLPTAKRSKTVLLLRVLSLSLIVGVGILSALLIHQQRPLNQKLPEARPPKTPVKIDDVSNLKSLSITMNLHLQGITWEQDENERFAVINGGIHKKGDEIRGFRIKAINRKSVTVTKKGESFELFLFKEKKENKEKEK